MDCSQNVTYLCKLYYMISLDRDINADNQELISDNKALGAGKACISQISLKDEFSEVFVFDDIFEFVFNVFAVDSDFLRRQFRGAE